MVLISEEMNCDIVIRNLVLVFLYCASIFGCRNSNATEFAKETGFSSDRVRN